MRVKKIIKGIKNIFSKHDTTTEEGKQLEREKRIYITAFTAAVSKVIATLIPLLTAKVTLSYLGEELYGLWATITSFFAFFAFADLGLGNGLQTELSRASGIDDNVVQCRKLISNAFIMLGIVASLLITVLLVANPFINWASVMNAQSDLTKTYIVAFVLAIFLSKLIDIPISVVNRTQNALQVGFIGNIWGIFGNLLSLGLVYLISKLNLGIDTMIWCSSFVIVFTTLLNFIIYFLFIKKDLRPSFRLFDFSVLKKLLGIGILFFLLSILTSASLSIDNYIVGKTVGLAEATPYSLSYKMALAIGVVSNMFSTPLWAALGEALQRGDFVWAKKQTRKMVLISLALSLLIGISLVLFSNVILNWLKPGMSISKKVLIFMCGTQVLIAVANPFFMILNANRNIWEQIVLYLVFALISLPLKFIFGSNFGQIGISMVGFFSYLIVIMPFVCVYSILVLKRSQRK